MKSLHLIYGLAAAAATAALACGMAGAQTTTNGSAAQPAPAATTSATTPARQSDMTSGQISRHATQTFVTEAGEANRGEIEEAKYVMDHTQSQAVKDFAQKMLNDHTKALDQLEQLASADGYKMPSSVGLKDKATLAKLKHEKTARIDTTYSSDQEKDHREVISKFEQAEQNPEIAPAMRKYARTSLPVLKDHLRMAQQLVASEGTRKTG